MHLLPFVALAVVVVVTPGVDMALVTRNALVHGRRAALLTAAGVNTGIFFWACAAALGLAALLAASAEAFTVVKIAGAAYLIVLGVRSILARELHVAHVRPAQSDLVAYRQGLVSNALNPKIAIFFTSVLPQFAGAHPSAGALILLGLVFNAIGWAWLLVYGTLAARGRSLLSRPRVRRALARVTGVVLVGLGMRLAFERRP